MAVRVCCMRACVYTCGHPALVQDVRELILEILAWSFRCLGFETTCMQFFYASKQPHIFKFLITAGRGTWPTMDPFGREFTSGYRKSKAGLRLAGNWRAAFAGLQGDQDFLHKILRFKRSLACTHAPRSVNYAHAGMPRILALQACKMLPLL